MVITCIVRGCSMSYGMRERPKMHRFPKNTALCKLWLEGIKKENTEPKTHWRICNRHFSSDDYVDGKLKSEAIPTLSPTSKIKIVECDCTAEEYATLSSEDEVQCLSRTELQSSNPEDKTISETIIIGTTTTQGTQTSSSIVIPSADTSKNIQLKKKVKTLQRYIQQQQKKLESVKVLLGHLRAKGTNSRNRLELQGHFSEFMQKLLVEKEFSGIRKNTRPKRYYPHLPW